MHLTVRNLSCDSVRCSWAPTTFSAKFKAHVEHNQADSFHVQATADYTASLSGRLINLKIRSEDKAGLRCSEDFYLHLRRRSSRRSWRMLETPETSQWRLALQKNSSKRYTLLLLPRRDLASFLTALPDDRSLSSVVLPGTHDTMAFYGWPISQCQYLDNSLIVQLNSGIRVIDIRLGIVKGQLVAYHGIYPQRTTFLSVLSTLEDFLYANPGECVVMSLMQEAGGDDHSPTLFSQLVHDEMEVDGRLSELFFLENRVPNLGEVRGKVILLSRFGRVGTGWEGDFEGMGIHPTTWPDSAREGFEWELKGTLVRTQDWYDISSFLAIPEKTARATQLLLPVESSSSSLDSSTSSLTLNEKETLKRQAEDKPTLNITFLSAASFPLASPPTVSQGFGWPGIGFGVEGVNSRVGAWLMDRLGEKAVAVDVHGWVMIDFYSTPDNGLPPLLIEFNFVGLS